MTAEDAYATVMAMFFVELLAAGFSLGRLAASREPLWFGVLVIAGGSAVYIWRQAQRLRDDRS